MVDEDYSPLEYVAMLIGNVTDVLEELPVSIFRVVEEGVISQKTDIHEQC
jgi:hypothetical protein